MASSNVTSSLQQVSGALIISMTVQDACPIGHIWEQDTAITAGHGKISHTHLRLVLVEHLKFDACLERDGAGVEHHSREKLRVTVVLEGQTIGGMARGVAYW